MYETLKFTEMTTRRVIDAKDKDGEKVYVKGHAKAIYMSDGRTVEDAIKQIGTGGGGGGGITVETDPIFSASPAASITEEDKEAWNNKVSYSVKDISVVNADGFMTSEGDGFVFPNTPAAQAGQGFVLATLDDIPNALTENDITAMGFTKNTGTYTKPNGGIPKSDLTEEVQNALRYAEQDRGTVNKIKVNGKNIGANNGVVDLGNLGTYSTYIADFTMESLRDGMYNVHQVECDMQALVAAMNANKIILVRESESSDYKGVYVLNGYAEDLLYFSIVDSQGNILYCNGTDYTELYIDGRDLYFHYWQDKQDDLVSGENIKTINGESIVGSGDITIEQGPKGDTGADGEDGATFTPSVDSAGNLSWSNDKGLANPPTVNIKGPKGDKGDAVEGGGGSSGGEGVIQWTMRYAPYYTNDDGAISLDPFVVYYNGDFSGGGTILFNVGDGEYNEWRIIFYTVGDTSLNIGIDIWVNGITPDISKPGLYELSVVDNEGVLLGVMAHYPLG